MEKEPKRAIYRGFNKSELEANIERDKKECRWIIVSEAILSNNPEWVLEVVYFDPE